MIYSHECKGCKTDFNISYYNQLVSEYMLIGKGQLDENPVVNSVITKINEVVTGDETVTCDDVYRLEKALAKLLPPEKAKLEIVNLRERYRSLVGEKKFSAYMATASKDDSPENLIRADIDFLLEEVHLHYTLMPTREKLRSQLIEKVAMITISYLAVVALFGIVLRFFNKVEIFPLVLVITFGSIGGFISMVRRLQDLPTNNDPTTNFLDLRYGQTSVILAPINGAIFAVVFMMLCIGKILEHSLFPTFSVAKLPADFFVNIALEDNVNYAKLLIWAFIAGFAERLVPDTLDRIIAKKQKEDVAQPKSIVPGV